MVAPRFRSGFEGTVAGDLTSRGVPFVFEGKRLQYKLVHSYTPDFQLPNGIFVETKGRFLPSDRTKHLQVREHNPHVDIRFVFMRAKTPLTKGSKQTYADWCDKHGFIWAEKFIPDAWIKEQKK